MDRRSFLESSGTAAACISSGAVLSMFGGCGRTTSQAQQPNIVIIALDDAGWKDFGYHN